MRQEIEAALQVLIGMPVLSVGRAADLHWFQFGTQHIVANSRGGTKAVGDYALHVQCAWRIRTNSKIIAASRDRYVPANGIEVDDFDWDSPGNNLCDHRIATWLKEIAEALPTVIMVSSDEVGILIEVFPDTSLVDEYYEHWRLFQPASETTHFVVSNSGLDLE
jgi:hypothetical protein